YCLLHHSCFSFNDTATTEIYPLSLHDALPISQRAQPLSLVATKGHSNETAGDKPEEGGDDVKSSWPLWVGLHTSYNGRDRGSPTDRKSTRLNSSHVKISYAVFCLKKKKKKKTR